MKGFNKKKYGSKNTEKTKQNGFQKEKKSKSPNQGRKGQR